MAQVRIKGRKKYPAVYRTVPASQGRTVLAGARASAPVRTGALRAGLYERTRNDINNHAFMDAVIAVRQANRKVRIAPPVPKPNTGKSNVGGAAGHTIFIVNGTRHSTPRRIF